VEEGLEERHRETWRQRRFAYMGTQRERAQTEGERDCILCITERGRVNEHGGGEHDLHSYS